MAKRGAGSAVLVGSWPELPFLLLGASALLALPLVLGQGGSWHTAIAAGLACLACPGAAIEMMSGLARLTSWLWGEDR